MPVLAGLWGIDCPRWERKKKRLKKSFFWTGGLRCLAFFFFFLSRIVPSICGFFVFFSKKKKKKHLAPRALNIFFAFPPPPQKKNLRRFFSRTCRKILHISIPFVQQWDKNCFPRRGSCSRPAFSAAYHTRRRKIKIKNFFFFFLGAWRFLFLGERCRRKVNISGWIALEEYEIKLKPPPGRFCWLLESFFFVFIRHSSL